MVADPFAPFERAARLCERAVIWCTSRSSAPLERRSLQRLIEAIEEPGARLDRRNVELLIMRMGALAVDAETVEGCGMRRGEIAVRAATAEYIARSIRRFSIATSRSTRWDCCTWQGDLPRR